MGVEGCVCPTKWPRGGASGLAWGQVPAGTMHCLVAFTDHIFRK